MLRNFWYIINCRISTGIFDRQICISAVCWAYEAQEMTPTVKILPTCFLESCTLVKGYGRQDRALNNTTQLKLHMSVLIVTFIKVHYIKWNNLVIRDKSIFVQYLFLREHNRSKREVQLEQCALRNSNYLLYLLALRT